MAFSDSRLHNTPRLASCLDFSRLSDSQRKTAAEEKYAHAIELYTATDLSIRKIAAQCGVTPVGLSAHIARNHRPLLFARYGLQNSDRELNTTKIRPPKGQSVKTHLKYKEAIEACGDLAYIELNISEIARLYGLNPSALSSQLRVHYPEIIPTRERARQRLGIADTLHRGPRPGSVSGYEEAIKMYRDTDLSIPEVASKCRVSPSGLSQFMRFYHQDIIAAKAGRREAVAGGSPRPGSLSGNGRLYGPSPTTCAQYQPALELYRTTDMSLEAIASAVGVPAEGLRAYINKWETKHPRNARTRMAQSRYLPAIESLRAKPRRITEVAAEFGLNPDVFRNYLKLHHPDLVPQQEMTRLPDGRLVRRLTYEKYQEAISEYAASAEPLDSIAQRHGLVYKSLHGFVMRNCAPEIEAHNRFLATASAKVAVAPSSPSIHQ